MKKLFIPLIALLAMSACKFPNVSLEVQSNDVADAGAAELPQAGSIAIEELAVAPDAATEELPSCAPSEQDASTPNEDTVADAGTEPDTSNAAEKEVDVADAFAELPASPEQEQHLEEVQRNEWDVDVHVSCHFNDPSISCVKYGLGEAHVDYKLYHNGLVEADCVASIYRGCPNYGVANHPLPNHGSAKIGGFDCKAERFYFSNASLYFSSLNVHQFTEEQCTVTINYGEPATLADVF